MTTEQIAKTIDHAVLHPTAGMKELEAEAALADTLGLFALCVKPCHTQTAHQLLKASEVQLCSVVSFPHGNSTLLTKLYETEEAINNGAAEIDFVINQAAAADGDWNYIRNEVELMNELCRNNKTPLKVIFENDFIHRDHTIITLCEICSRAEVAFVKSSTGFGFHKQENGYYNYHGATERQVQLMLDHVRPPVKVKASGGIRDLDTARKYLQMGVARLGTSSAAQILAEAKRKSEKA